MSWSDVLNTPAQPIPLDAPKVFNLPRFDGYQDPKKLDVLTRLSESYGRDPRLATLAVSIFRDAGVEPRDYKGQAAALLRWVQTNIYYVNEPDERLQTPDYTLRVRYGDCDDMAILLYSLARSVRLPAKFVISGVTQKNGKKARYHYGDASFPRGVSWSHIYLALGDKPYGEPTWWYAEPTLKVPLGWDVVGANSSALVEMNQYAGSATGAAAAGAVAGVGSSEKGVWWKEMIFAAAAAGVGALASEIVLDYYHEWKKSRKARAK
jgi:transglutaminase-like putative cysteine protease